MLRNYLKVAVRYLSRHKGYTFINVLGLGVGIACCILLMLFVKSELTFDRFHEKSGRLYRAWLEEHYQGEVFRNTATPVPLAPVLQAGLPEAETTCRIVNLAPIVTYGNNSFTEQVGMADSTFFHVFDFPFEVGSKASALATTNSIVLTASAAKKYFGNSPAIDKSLELQLGEAKVLFTVTAVVRDLPLESSIRYTMLIPFSNAHHLYSEAARTTGWSNVSVSTFVLLKQGADPSAVDKKIATIMNPLVAKDYKPGEYLVRLQPLSDIHFNATLPAEMDRDSNPKYSYILGTIGILVLFIACINFVTLSIGRSATRALEVGVRKVLGAGRKQLVRQFWGESVILALLALLVGILLAFVLLKPFNQLAGRELSLAFNGFTFLFCFLILALIALLAGMYPAVIVSGFKPIEVLKGKLTGGYRIGFFRKALVVGQFVASIIMIIATISVSKQLDYLRSKDLGYQKEHVIVVPTNLPRLEGTQLALRFKNELAGHPQILSSTASLYSMAEYGWMQLGYTDKQNIFRRFRFNVIDTDFIPSMGLQVVKGRTFSKDNAADSNAILVNEALVKEYGWKDPVGQKLPGKYDQAIIGVVKDFHLESLHATIKPAMLALKADSIFRQSSDVTYDFSPRPRISVRFKEGNIQEHLDLLKATWKSVAGDRDFEYQFLDEALATAYQQEQRLGNIVRYASVLSIFIACMGLFGLATLVVVRRTKEIGIRKVLGAEVTNIVTLLSKDFVFMVLIASLIAFPIAWWALNKWLQDFAYRIHIPIALFVLSAVIALLIALLTVSIQAIRAALMNPVKSLRTE